MARKRGRRREWRQQLDGVLQGARRLPPLAWAAFALLLLLSANALYQVARKPAELAAAVTPPAPKLPAETWRAYGPLFREHATAAIRPELLAALVQAESSGDPMALPSWRLRFTTNPFALYAPASSAVGILQITDGNYARARELCIHDHEVARTGPWYDPRTCFLNALYLRTVPGDSIEMTAAYLDVAVREILARPGVPRPSAQDRDLLAAVVHLCGPDRGAAFALRGHRVARGERCGEQDVAAYLARVRLLVAVFAQEAARG